MSRRKQARFKENIESEYVIQPGKAIFDSIKGNWSTLFGNTNPIVLEVGCGRAEYTTGLAELFPQKNFIGIDLKGGRLWKGSMVSEEKNLKNTAFLRIILQNIEDFFEENEADEIWITFPDPRPRLSDEKRRLTSPRYLRKYVKVLKPGGWINFKTDNKALFDYTLQVLQAGEDVKNGAFIISDLEYTFDLYNSSLQLLTFGIQTTFEKKYLQDGAKIHFMRFRIA